MMEEMTIENSAVIVADEKRYSQYMTFMLGSDIYGIPVSIIKEVDRYGKVFTVPRSPACIKGIINLRGDVIPVIDLNKRLFNNESTITALTSIIIIQLEQEGEIIQIGVMNDCVKTVADIADEDIEASPGFALNVRKEFIRGIGKMQENFIILLEIQSVLNLNEISQLFQDAVKTDTVSVLQPDASGNARQGG
ncbi:MAG: chemotaxis protein CheW [Spirochaetes bacterium]|nr:chemotaxis protein CheW [Spirochaetota bacterium]